MAVNLCSVVFLTINNSLNTPNFIVLLKSCILEPVLSACTQVLSESGINAKAVDIQEYVTDTYGQTIQEIRMAARVAVLAAALVMFVVVVLFTRLLVAKDRQDISLRKALGFTGGDIKRLYFLGYLPVLLAGMLLKTLGATGFRFLIDYKIICGCIPAVTAITVFCAILLGLSEVKHIRAYECCMGKE